MPDSRLEASTFNMIDEALTALKNGGFIVVSDDESRENEGDLLCAASLTTPEMVNFMAGEARGLICVALTPPRCDALDLPQMVANNTDPHGTGFTVSVDAAARFGVTTGISAFDRAATLRQLAAQGAVPSDFRRPGHIFPLRAAAGGIHERKGHTEAAIEFMRLAELPLAGVICEILNKDGTMARRDALAAFAQEHRLPFVTIAALLAYPSSVISRRNNERSTAE